MVIAATSATTGARQPQGVLSCGREIRPKTVLKMVARWKKMILTVLMFCSSRRMLEQLWSMLLDADTRHKHFACA